MLTHKNEDLIGIDREADRLAEIHGTTKDHELDRQARERGRRGWSELVGDQPAHLRDAFLLRDEWMRPPIETDGDVGGWDLVPSFNPIADDRLPVGHDPRAARILAIATLLVWTSNPVCGLRPADEDRACALAAAFIRWEVADADAQGRQPTLAGCDALMRAFHERLQVRVAAGPRDAAHFLDALRDVARQRLDIDPEGSAFLVALADAGVGWAGYVVSGAERAFLRFRNPAIAALTA